MTTSADDYLAEVSNILSDLPTPTINGAVMRGASIRFSSAAEGIPGPRRLVLDGPTAGRPLATGMTAAVLLARQRKNLTYLQAQRSQLADNESRAAVEVRSPDLREWDDHAAEVLDILRAVPLLKGRDFTDVFGELADLAGMKQHGETWEVRTAGGVWTGMPLDGLGDGFALDALKAQTEANAARLRRWRTALCAGDENPGGGPDVRRTSAAASSEHDAPTPAVTPAPVVQDALEARKVALQHHERALSADAIAERRRKFPELFPDVDFSSPSRLVGDKLRADRRHRFPELFAQRSLVKDRQPGEDGFELG